MGRIWSTFQESHTSQKASEKHNKYCSKKQNFLLRTEGLSWLHQGPHFFKIRIPFSLWPSGLLVVPTVRTKAQSEAAFQHCEPHFSFKFLKMSHVSIWFTHCSYPVWFFGTYLSIFIMNGIFWIIYLFYIKQFEVFCSRRSAL